MLLGTVDSSEGGWDEGAVFELAVPRSLIQINNGMFRFTFTLDNEDRNKKSETDAIYGAVEGVPSSWPAVRLK